MQDVTCTFFMNKLSCLEHLSTLSFSTEMSVIMLQRKVKHKLVKSNKPELQHTTNMFPCRCTQTRPHTLCWRTWACCRACQWDREGFGAPAGEPLGPRLERKTEAAPGKSWAVLSACWWSGNPPSPEMLRNTGMQTTDNFTWSKGSSAAHSPLAAYF